MRGSWSQLAWWEEQGNENQNKGEKKGEVHINTKRGQTLDKQKRGGELCNKDEDEHEEGY
jgi:hypothetical protein